MESITITMTTEQALAVVSRLIERQQIDKRNLTGYTPSYLKEIRDVDAVLYEIKQKVEERVNGQNTRLRLGG